MIKIYRLSILLYGKMEAQSATYSERTYTRNVLIRSKRSQGERRNKRRACVTHKPVLQRLQQVAIVCISVFVFLFPTRQKLRFHLSYSHTSSLVFDVREPLCVKYENAWHCVAQAATQAKWYNKGTIPIYASAACLPRERRIIKQRKHSIRVVEEIPARSGKMGHFYLEFYTQNFCRDEKQ